MTRLECEVKLLGLLEQMQAIYKEYNPSGTHLSMYIMNGSLSATDYFKDEDGNLTDEHTIDFWKNSDGHMWFNGKRAV